MSFTELFEHWRKCEAEERPEKEAVAHKNMKEIMRLTNEMREEGWREIAYCPKGGTLFWAWEPFSSLPYKCSYRGEWPTGSWLAYTDGDIWPARPSLFKLIEEDASDA